VSLAQLKNTGNLEATEFSEISYAGKGDGASVYINTLIPANTIDNFEIVWKHDTLDATSDCLFGVRNTTSAYFQDYNHSGTVTVYIGNSSAPSTLASMVVGNVYKRQIIKMSASIYQCILTNLTTNTLIQDYTFNPIGGSIPDKNLYIYARNTFDTSSINAYAPNTIYSFTINSETWYINNGTGNTITGSLGTVLTVNGTLTNFWQQSGIWNEDANLKMYNTGLVKCNEFDEVSTTYAGKGDGASIYIDTLVKPVNITNFEITFKWAGRGTANENLFGVLNDSNRRFYFATRAPIETDSSLALFTSTVAIQFAPYLIVNNKYTLSLTMTNSGHTVNCIFTNLTTNTVVLNTSYTNNSYLLEDTNNLYIYCMNYSSRYYTTSTIYSFTINSETWNISRGYGNTITGDKGTVLNISGTLHNFWQINTRSVEQYCGKGNGTNISINTNILPKDVTYFKIRKTYNNNAPTTTRGHGSYNVVSGSERDFMIFNTSIYGTEYFCYGLAYRTATGLVENTIYDYIIELTSSQTKINYYIIDVLTGVTVYTATNISIDINHLIGMTRTICICYANGSVYSPNKVYSFQINDEIWYINQGTGTSITGSLGTVLTVSGTTTSFWQPSEIWNDPAQMKLLENELDVKNEIVEI